MVDQKQYLSYELYNDANINRMNNEVDKVVRISPNSQHKFKASDFTHFDCLNYLRNAYGQQLFDTLQLNENSKVFDICSGLGAGSRLIADRYKSHITSLDFIPALNNIHRKINDLCGLSSNMNIVQGDASQVDVREFGIFGQCDLAFSIQSFYYIKNKKGLLKVCNDSLKLGGKLYIEDYVVENDLPFSEEENKLLDQFKCESMMRECDYRENLEEAGFHVDSYIHRSKEFSTFVWKRAEYFLENKQKIIDEYGHNIWDTTFTVLITVPTKLFQNLGLTLEEAVSAYPLLYQKFGHDEFKKWVVDVPSKMGGGFILATKVK